MGEEHRLVELPEKAFDSGLDPEQCYASNPELSPELRQALEACRVLTGELDLLFPSPDEKSGHSSDRSPRTLPSLAGYEVISVLGSGGMGVVFKARHRALNRLVAIKMMIADCRYTAIERERIRREAEALAKLRHPNIVEVFDVGELDGRPYFTMEIMEGGVLAAKLRGVPQSADYMASTMIMLVSAVEAAHKVGIVHRDLKPSNVLLTSDGVPKISDFGIAREIANDDHLTLSGVRMNWAGQPLDLAEKFVRGSDRKKRSFGVDLANATVNQLSPLRDPAVSGQLSPQEADAWKALLARAGRIAAAAHTSQP